MLLGIPVTLQHVDSLRLCTYSDHEYHGRPDRRPQTTTRRSLTLAIVADCRRKQGGRNQGSSQLTTRQWLTCVECKLTSRTTNSKQTKKRRQDTSNYSKPQEKAGKVQTKANTANTFRTLLLRQCGCGLAYRQIDVGVVSCACAYKLVTKILF